MYGVIEYVVIAWDYSDIIVHNAESNDWVKLDISLDVSRIIDNIKEGQIIKCDLTQHPRVYWMFDDVKVYTSIRPVQNVFINIIKKGLLLESSLESSKNKLKEAYLDIELLNSKIAHMESYSLMNNNSNVVL